MWNSNLEGFTPHANALRICRFFGIIVVILNHESKWLLFSNAINSIPNLWSTVKYINISVDDDTLCKVEFNQSSCWLYFVPNLLVFQQLVTLYLCGILVRVVSERVWRLAQECARKTGTRDWISRVTRGCNPPKGAHVLSMPEVEASCQLKHYRTK